MIAFSLLYEKRKATVCVWKVFQDDLLPGFPVSLVLNHLRSFLGESTLTKSLHQAFILVGPLNFGVIANTSMPLPTLSQLSLRHLACGS